MARMVATKASLSIRLDALADADTKSQPLDGGATIGIENRVKLEARLRQLEAGQGFSSLRSLAKANGGADRQQKKFEMKGTGAGYAAGADAVALVPTGVEPGLGGDEGVEVMKVDEEEDDEARRKREKKEKKERRKSEKGADGEDEVRFCSCSPSLSSSSLASELVH